MKRAYKNVPEIHSAVEIMHTGHFGQDMAMPCYVSDVHCQVCQCHVCHIIDKCADVKRDTIFRHVGLGYHGSKMLVAGMK